jgi:hypothetical protein
MMAFHVGQKVCLIKDYTNNPWPKHYPELPTTGKVYTVRKVFIAPDDGREGLMLSEIICEINPRSGIECGWIAAHFRPVVTRKTDISLFQAMLRPTDKRVDA